MFSDELAIVLKTANGEEFSVFVPREVVRGDVGTEGRVQVRVYQEGGTSLAVLPTAEVTIVPVADEDLAAA